MKVSPRRPSKPEAQDDLRFIVYSVRCFKTDDKNKEPITGSRINDDRIGKFII